MSRYGWSALMFCTAVAFAAVALTGAVRSPGEREVAPRTARALDAVSARTVAERVRTARAERRRSTPVARAERRRTRTRYAQADAPSAALAVLRGTHPALVARRPTAGPLAKEHVVEYLDDHTARIDGGPGQADSLVHTTLPNRTADGRPIDIALRDTPEGPRSTNPLVPVELPRRAGGTMRLTGTGLGVRPLGMAASDARIVDGRSLYAGAAQDADLLITPLVDGFETFAIMRSQRSPETLTLDLDLAAGARVSDDDRLGGLTVKRGDDVLARISPAVAWDADQQPVPATQRMDGNRLVLSVDHRDRDVRYPVVLDPEFIAEQQSWKADSAADYRGWRTTKTAGTSTTPKFVHFNGDSSLHGRGLYMYNRTLQSYATGDFGEWAFNGPGHGEAFVYKTTFAATRHTPELSSLYRGIYDRNAGRFHDGFSFIGDGPPNGAPKGASPTSTTLPIVVDETETHCGRTDCAPGTAEEPGGPKRSSVVWGVRIDNPAGNRTNFTGYVGGSTIYQSDHYAPSITSEAFPTAWVKEAAGLAVRGTDLGLGMKSLTIESPQNPDWQQEQTNTSACTGNRVAPCGSFLRIPFTSEGLPEGRVDVKTTGTDILTEAREATFGLKLDRTPPRVTLGGALGTTRGMSLPPEQKAQLTISADDGTNRSGVRSYEIKVDGVQRGIETERECLDTGQCPATGAPDAPYVFDQAAFGDGHHTIEVIVRDDADNVFTDSWDFYSSYQEAADTDAEEGYVDEGEYGNGEQEPEWCRPESDDPYCGEDDASNPSLAMARSEAPLSSGLATPLIVAPLDPLVARDRAADPQEPGEGLGLGGDRRGYALNDGQAVDPHDDKRFDDLNVQRYRVVIPWNIALLPPKYDNVRTYYRSLMNKIRMQGQEPLIALDDGLVIDDNDSTPENDHVGDVLPSESSLANGFKQLRLQSEFSWVRLFTPWNEPNLDRSNTVDKPERVANFWDRVARQCSRPKTGENPDKCVAVAGDFYDSYSLDDKKRFTLKLDNGQTVAASYFRVYKANLSHKPRVWSIHAYITARYKDGEDTDKKNTLARFRAFMRGTRAETGKPATKVWITELGGIVRQNFRGVSRTRKDATDGAPDSIERENHAKRLSARDLRWGIFTLPSKLDDIDRTGLSRIYQYNWSSSAKMDTGLIDHSPDGLSRDVPPEDFRSFATRPGFDVFKAAMETPDLLP